MSVAILLQASSLTLQLASSVLNTSTMSRAPNSPFWRHSASTDGGQSTYDLVTPDNSQPASQDPDVFNSLPASQDPEIMTQYDPASLEERVGASQDGNDALGASQDPAGAKKDPEVAITDPGDAIKVPSESSNEEPVGAASSQLSSLSSDSAYANTEFPVQDSQADSQVPDDTQAPVEDNPTQVPVDDSQAPVEDDAHEAPAARKKWPAKTLKRGASDVYVHVTQKLARLDQPESQPARVIRGYVRVQPESEPESQV